MVFDIVGWNGVAQAIIVAICSWYVRRGAKKDSKEIKTAGEAQLSTSQQILDRIGTLEVDMTLVKRCIFRENGVSQFNSKGFDHGKTV